MGRQIKATDERDALRQSRRGAIDPFIVMDVMRAANAREAAGENIIHMEVGQPATPAPEAALDAARQALAHDRLGYTEALGLPALRRRIARHYGEWYDLDLNPDRVVVTAGSSAGFLLAFLALFDAGERVALAAPGYPCYRHILKSLDLQGATLGTGPENRWMPTAKDISQAADQASIDGLLLASPANPTGTMLADARLQEIVELCDDRAISFISDEIYHGLTYDRPAQTALRWSDSAIIINSFSKYFSMTGWRIGWMVAPERLVRVIERLAQNLYICAPAISQHSALGAFEGMAELESHKQVYRANRELLLEGLPRAGFHNLVPPDGAFYIYADVSDLTDDSVGLATQILSEAGVAVTPGADFDPEHGRRYLRFSYARSTQDMTEALRRLKAWRSGQI